MDSWFLILWGCCLGLWVWVLLVSMFSLLIGTIRIRLWRNGFLFYKIMIFCFSKQITLVSINHLLTISTKEPFQLKAIFNSLHIFPLELYLHLLYCASCSWVQVKSFHVLCAILPLESNNKIVTIEFVRMRYLIIDELNM